MLALLLGACSNVQPSHQVRQQPSPIPDDTFSPVVAPALSARQRIIDIALQEWNRWGQQRVSIGKDGHACVEASAALSLRSSETHDGDRDTPCISYADGQGTEATSEGCALALRYWHLLGRDPACDDITQPRWAWSAAFISWVMRQAGLTEAQFLTGQAHNLYVTDARDGVLPTPAFHVEPYPALPQPGDMVCSARDTWQDVTRVEQIRAGHTAMHCDIVVEMDAEQRIVKAIGGNVQQSVSMSLIPWPDAAGIGEEGAEAYAPWLLVMRNLLP